MLKFILKRLLVTFPMLLGIALLTFVLMRVTPGNYLDSLRMDPQFSEETIAQYEELYQLNKPVLVQYFHWIKNLFRCEFGYSFHYNVPVIRIIGGRLYHVFSSPEPLNMPHSTSGSSGRSLPRGRYILPSSKSIIVPSSCRRLASRAINRLPLRLVRRQSCSVVMALASCTVSGSRRPGDSFAITWLPVNE